MKSNSFKRPVYRLRANTQVRPSNDKAFNFKLTHFHRNLAKSLKRLYSNFGLLMVFIRIWQLLNWFVVFYSDFMSCCRRMFCQINETNENDCESFPLGDKKWTILIESEFCCYNALILGILFHIRNAFFHIWIDLSEFAFKSFKKLIQNFSAKS